MLPRLFIWLVVISYWHYIEVHSLVGEYVDVSITKGEAINTTGDFGDLTGVKVRKVNRKHVISGDFHYKKGLSNDQQCKVLFYKKQGGEYRLLSYKIPAQGCCDFYNSDNFIVPELAKVCKKCPKQEDKVCPWPGDNYLVENLDVDIKKIPPYFEGDFKAEFQIVQDDQLLLGYNFYGTIIR